MACDAKIRDSSIDPCSPIECTGCGCCLLHCTCPNGAGDLDLLTNSNISDDHVFDPVDITDADTAIMPVDAEATDCHPDRGG